MIEQHLTQAILGLTEMIALDLEWRKSHEGFATKHDLKELEHKIMSAISDFTTKVQAFFDRQDKAITDLQDDVKTLNDQIAALQASNGAITPEDQAALDAITERASTISDKLDALDALTPPVVTPPDRD